MQTLRHIDVYVEDYDIVYRDWTNPAPQRIDQRWRSAHERALRCWLWAKPLGIKVEQVWFDWDEVTRMASEDETLKKLLEALKVENACGPAGPAGADATPS